MLFQEPQRGFIPRLCSRICTDPTGIPNTLNVNGTHSITGIRSLACLSGGLLPYDCGQRD